MLFKPPGRCVPKAGGDVAAPPALDAVATAKLGTYADGGPASDDAAFASTHAPPRSEPAFSALALLPAADDGVGRRSGTCCISIPTRRPSAEAICPPSEMLDP
jgi:hypothetical protein